MTIRVKKNPSIAHQELGAKTNQSTRFINSVDHRT